MPRITMHATFSPDDDPTRISSALDCPTCGRHDPGDAALRIKGGAIRALFPCCATFLTLHVTTQQARALQRILHPDAAPRERISESRGAARPALSRV